MELDRRLLLQFGAFGAGALAIPGAAAAIAARGFTHGVASGEPSQNSVLLWTRYVSARDTMLHAEVSESPSFERVVDGGSVTASAEHDHTAKLTATGLQPGRWYYYRFRAANGDVSPVGRTRTLPDGPVGRFGLGVFSCSNLPFGWFNAYAHAAVRDDLDVMVHLGDYLYEYQRGRYPAESASLPGRLIDPASEIIQLADYRLRHAAYLADPDLCRLRQSFPLIAMWDDHESANNSWIGGAENHQPATEGAWAVRKAAAARAYREWLPVADSDYQEYRIGDLATIFRPETRLTGRTIEHTLAEAAAGADLKAALTAFRDGPWQDPSATIMGLDQERRLAEGLRRSAADGVRWQVLAQQVLMGSVFTPPEAVDWLGPNADARSKTHRQIELIASSLNLPENLDSWDGYPAARSRLLKSAQDANANLVVLSGDTHNCWAYDLDQGGAPAGVELAGQSVTSPGLESEIPVSPSDAEQAVMRRNPALKWANFERRGYLSVEITPSHVTGEWNFLETIRQRSTALAGSHRMRVAHGSNRLS